MSLSLGQKQLVALAGALVMKLPILSLMEPLPCLIQKIKLDSLKSSCAEENLWYTLGDHILDDLRCTDRVLVLHKGAIIFDGSTLQ